MKKFIVSIKNSEGEIVDNAWVEAPNAKTATAKARKLPEVPSVDCASFAVECDE